MHTFDTTKRPQDDYFGYVNNPWLAANPIPASEASWGTFYVLRDEASKAVHEIIQKLATADETTLSHDQHLLKTFFKTALSCNEFKDNHLRTLQDELRNIEQISTKKELANYIGRAHRLEMSLFWSEFVDLDDKNSHRQVLRFHQDGLSLPNRDYYLDEGEEMQHIRKEYAKYYQKVAELLPDNSLGPWQPVYDIEMALATGSWTDVELRDIENNYTKFTRGTLAERFPSFDWDAFTSGMNWSGSDELVVNQPSFFDTVFTLIEERPLKDIKAYIAWHAVNELLSWFSETSAQMKFDFYGKVVSGTKEMKPLWKRAVQQTDRLIIGEALGREYAMLHFPESSKRAVLDIVEEIRSAYHTRIDRLTWMSDATKKRAHAKLNNITVFIGYPSIWKDFTKLTFCDDNHLENMLRAAAFTTDHLLAKVGHPPAEEEWHMNAHTVNAYHDPNRLEIVFPAAILQAPFYDPNASHAANLGGIGAVIGHEFTHGFDDQGAQFDEQGNVNPWQSKEERARFDALAQNIVELADAFETVPGTFLQGKLILGEAIADIGGLQLALEAYCAIAPEASLEELFVNFATCECGQATKETLVVLAKTDPHPPSPFRVNRVVNHTDDFYTTYNVQPSDALYLPPEKRAKIW